MSNTTIYTAQSIAEAREAVIRSSSPILPVGGQSKNTLSRNLIQQMDGDIAVLDLSQLAGILEYNPGEYTITALAGTTLSDVQSALAEHGQYMPFDPLLIDAGATLGGTVAAGVSGSGRYRYGGIRDFLIGIRFVDGRGQVVLGGGKVVKNSAGFDLPKLMVGSLGRLGVLVEVSLKVFPQPPVYQTVRAEYDALEDVLAALTQLTVMPLDMDALDIWVEETRYALLIRQGGLPAILTQRAQRLLDTLGRGQIVDEADEDALWNNHNAFAWQSQDAPYLVKIPVTVKQIPILEPLFAGTGAAQRRYTVGGNLAWVGWSQPLSELDAFLQKAGLSGLVVRSLGNGSGNSDSDDHAQNSDSEETPPPIYLGKSQGQAFAQRIKDALDPAGQFLSLV